MNTLKFRTVVPLLLSMSIMLPISSCQFRSLSPDQFQQLTMEAQKCESEGQLNDAEKKWQSAVDAAAKFGDKDERYTTSLHALAQLQSNLAEYPQAEENFEKLIAIEDKYYKGEFLGVAWNLSELGDAYYQQGQYQKAMETYKKSADIGETSRRLLEMISSTRKLADAYVRLGENKKGAMSYLKAWAFGHEAMRLPQFADYQYALADQCAQVDADRADFCNKHQGYKEGTKFVHLAEKEWGTIANLSYVMERPPAPSGRLSKLISPPYVQLTKPPATMLDEVGPNLVSALEKLAFFYSHMGKYAQSELLFARIIEVYDQMAATNKSIQAMRPEFISELYRSWRSCDSATPTYMVADEFYRQHLKDKKLQSVENPYLVEFASIRRTQDFYQKRLDRPQRFAWAVPTTEAVLTLKAFQPIVEAGAGTGYWAYLMRKMGVDVVAFDIKPVPSHDNAWHFRATKSWTQVLPGDESVAAKYPDRTLFISWPPGNDPFAYNALSQYKGKTFIYVGEEAGGCNGDNKFFYLLAREWQLKNKIAIPQWPSIYDSMYVYERKKK